VRRVGAVHDMVIHNINYIHGYIRVIYTQLQLYFHDSEFRTRIATHHIDNAHEIDRQWPLSTRQTYSELHTVHNNHPYMKNLKTTASLELRKKMKKVEKRGRTSRKKQRRSTVLTSRLPWDYSINDTVNISNTMLDFHSLHSLQSTMVINSTRVLSRDHTRGGSLVTLVHHPRCDHSFGHSSS
jgi:hypothetical protein